MQTFLGLLPRETAEAAKLATKHDDKLKAPAWTRIDISRLLRYAIEVRHDSFMTPDFFDLLRRCNVAFVFADTAKKWPYAEDLTADFIYIRLHGAEEIYVSGYGDHALNWWAERIEKWQHGRQPLDATVIGSARGDNRARDVFVYFDNDAKVFAPFDAIRLCQRLQRVEQLPVDRPEREPRAKRKCAPSL